MSLFINPFVSAADYKKAVHTVKKASSDTVRLQKKANKGIVATMMKIKITYATVHEMPIGW